MAVPKFIRPCWLNLVALECPSISAVALAVVIGSVRSNRFADHAAGWIVAALSLMTFLSTVTPAFAQSRDINTNAVPMAFGSKSPQQTWLLTPPPAGEVVAFGGASTSMGWRDRLQAE
jgi:hypothetical protein